MRDGSVGDRVRGDGWGSGEWGGGDERMKGWG